jgi:hypothetical protein
MARAGAIFLDIARATPCAPVLLGGSCGAFINI